MSNKQKKKVAILGGGCASMTAAYYLSNTPKLRDELEVTVYQMGWRLGGKGASGRQRDCADRILEHGLHVWGGFYENAFHTMRACYEELDRPSSDPLAKWDEAFRPFPLVLWTEKVRGEWVDWPIEVPSNSSVPGDGSEFPSIWNYMQMLLGWMKTAIEDFPYEDIGPPATRGGCLLGAVIRAFEVLIGRRKDHKGRSPVEHLHDAHDKAGKLHGKEHHEEGHHHLGLMSALELFREWLSGEIPRSVLENDAARRSYILIDLGAALLSGIMKDKIWLHGWFVVDDEDLVDWFRRHGASELACTSAPIRGFYDYFFAYEDGDPQKPRMSAGMGLHHMMRLVGTYKGTLFYKMSSGMGDAVFGPLWEMCRRNGVKFEFFHQVDSLELADGEPRVDKIKVLRQVDLKGDEYLPLFDVKGLPSWPSEPLWEQIDDEQAKEIRARGANLEDPWTNWKPVETLELEHGKDFDAVVLGLSVGAFQHVCRDILAKDEDWRLMVEKVQSIQTQAFQLWYTPSREELGWDMGNATGTGFGQPYESWSDMSHALPQENWPAGEDPKFVVYFCGPQKNPPAMPTHEDPGYGEKEKARAKEAAFDWSKRCLGHLYPGAVQPDNLEELHYEPLHAPADKKGKERFDAQFFRSNYTPTERYVVDLPGSNQYRFEADTSGYENLALAGDWLFTGLGGAVEAAVISGMQAAKGLGGCDEKIVGALRSPWGRTSNLKKLV